VSTRIAISLIVLAILIVGGYAIYRRYIASMHVDSDVRPVNGARLTSERLQQLPSPPWRFVLEIGGDRLGGIDHVIIGPSGVIAASTLMFDRPADAGTPDPQQMAAAAMMRSPVDELAARAGLSCDTLAKIYWGAPQPERPAALDSGLATVAVEGQRLADWLLTLPPGPLAPAQIDLAWQAILTGIGRPDPLA
jgi:hypothetical protein